MRSGTAAAAIALIAVLASVSRVGGGIVDGMPDHVKTKKRRQKKSETGTKAVTETRRPYHCSNAGFESYREPAFAAALLGGGTRFMWPTRMLRFDRGTWHNQVAPTLLEKVNSEPAGGNPGAGFGGARVVKITPDAGGPVDVALEFLRREVQLAAARLAERHAFGSAGDDVWAGSSSKTMSRRAAEAARQRRGAGSPRVLREVRLHRIEAWDLAAPGSKVLRHTARHPTWLRGVYCLAVGDNHPGATTKADRIFSSEAPGPIQVIFNDPRGDVPYVRELPRLMQPISPYSLGCTRPGMAQIFPGDVPVHTTAALPGTLPTVLLSFEIEVVEDAIDAETEDCDSVATMPGDEAEEDEDADPSPGCGGGGDYSSYVAPKFSVNVPRHPGTEIIQPGVASSGEDIWSPYEISSTATIKDGSTMLSEVTDVTRWGTPIGVMPLKRGPERDSLLTMLTADMTGLRTTIEAEYGEWDAGTVFQSDPDNRATSLRQARGAGMQGALSIVQSATQRYLEQRTPCENFNPNAYGCYEFDREPGVVEILANVSHDWINIAGPGEHAVNQEAHHHLPVGTTVSGLVYVRSGWSDDGGAAAAGGAGRFVPQTEALLNSTAIALLRPSPYNAARDGPYARFSPTTGSVLLFPTFLLHAADVHRGDSERRSVAFNVRVDLTHLHRVPPEPSNHEFCVPRAQQPKFDSLVEQLPGH